MKGKYCSITFVLLIGIFGALALTSSEYVDCKGFYPDQFLDFASVWQYPILSVFARRLDAHSYRFHSLKIFNFQRIDLLTPILRC